MHRASLKHLTSALGVVASLGLAACGSRSTLYDLGGSNNGGSGGVGGSGPTTSNGGSGPVTTSSSGGSAGTFVTSTGPGGSGGTGGGGLGPCSQLEYAKPFASLQGGTMSHQRSPMAAYSSDDQMSVTIASSWQVVQGPGNPPIELRHTTLEPWGDFPVAAGLGPTYLADLDAGVSFAIAQGQGKHFAMLFRDFQQPPAGGLRFSEDFVPKSGDIPASFLADAQARRAAFLTRGAQRYAYGSIFRQGDTFELRTGLIANDVVEVDFPLSCATDAPVADAMLRDDSLFVAYTAGSDGMDCDSGPPAAPNRLRIARIDGVALTGVTELVNNAAADVVLAPRSDGAWLVWSDSGDQFSPPSINAARLDTNGQLNAGEWWSLPTNFTPGSLAAASQGDALLVGWIEPEPEGASPRVQALHPNGDFLASIKVEATGKAEGRLHLLASPIAPAFLLSWSETAGGGLGDQVRVTRIDCIGPAN